MTQPETLIRKRYEAMRVRMLSEFTVSVGTRTIRQDEWRLRKAAALVKLLTLAPGHRLHREQIMELLWPDSGRGAASNSLRKTLHDARKVFEPYAGSLYLASEDESLVLCPGGDLGVDAEAFEEAVTTARRSQDPATYRASIELYAGDLLPEDRYEEWTEPRREELRQLYLDLLVELAALYEGRHQYDPAVEVLRKAVAEEPTNEAAHLGLMRAYALLGRKTEALAQFERLKGALSTHLGAEPGAEKTFRKAYRKCQKIVQGGDNRRMKERTLAVVRFVIEHTDDDGRRLLSWSQLTDLWNEEHPGEWSFKDRFGLRKAYLRAEKELAGP